MHRNVSAFVSASLELMSDNIPNSLLSVEEKSKIQSNLMRVLFLAAGNGNSFLMFSFGILKSLVEKVRAIARARQST